MPCELDIINFNSKTNKNNTLGSGGAGGNTIYKIYGDLSSSKTPILFINGGPGGNYEYLKPFQVLKDSVGPVILYNQIGNNLKEHTKQLVELIEFFNLEKVHLVGHSYGTIIALETYIKIPKKIKSIVFYSPCISIKLWQEQANKYVKKIKEFYKKNGINKPSKRQIEQKYIVDYVWRENVSIEKLKNIPTFEESWGINYGVYNKIWGESELNVNGELKNYDKTHLLKDIKIPMIFYGGKYDTASEFVIKNIINNNNIPYFIFNRSSHISHLEEPKIFFEKINKFYNNI